MKKELVIAAGNDLELRLLTVEDAPDIFRTVNLDPAHHSCFGDSTARECGDLVMIEKRLANPANPLKMSFAIRRGEKFVGSINLTPCDYLGTVELVLGYWIGVPYIKRGIATLSAQATIDFAFCHLKFNRVLAIVHTENRPSIRVLEKCGFVEDKNSSEGDELFFVVNNNNK